MLQSIISQVENGHSIYTKDEVLDLLKTIQESLAITNDISDKVPTPDHIYTVTQDTLEELFENVKGLFQKLGLSAKRITNQIKEEASER